MTDSHLLNTIKFLGRKRLGSLMDAATCASMMQGEQALATVEAEAELADQIYEDWLSFLTAEAKQRGLKK